MDTLITHVINRLATHASCTVFENEIRRVWPLPGHEQAKRNADIRSFAKQQGWDVKINDPGVRVTFKKHS